MKEELHKLCKQMRLAQVMNIYEQVPFEHPTQFLHAVLSSERSSREQGKPTIVAKSQIYTDKYF